MIRSCLIPLVLVGSLQAGGPTVPQAMDALMAPHFKADGPGAVALVLKGGKRLFHKAYGLASLELGVPLRPDSVFEAASATKSLTAAAVLRLAEEGRLDLKAPVSRYLPDTPATWSAVTVEHLLTHTSGIRSLWEDPTFGPRVREDLTPSQLVAELQQRNLAFEPGSAVAYSTANYSVLALLVERLSDVAFPAYVQAHFLDPLGMKRTTFSRHDKLIRGRASGYTHDRVPPPYLARSLGFGGGDYATTAEDLATWYQALLGGRVLSPASLRAMTTGFRLKDGRTTRYGYGLDLFELQGRPFIGHTGDIPGYHAAAFGLPEAGITVVVLYNGEPDLEPAYFAKRLAALALGQPLPDPKAVALPERALEALVGRYTDGHRTEEIRLEGGRLLRVGRSGRPEAIFPLSPTECFFEATDDTRLHFLLEGGKATGLRWSSGQHGLDPLLRRME